MNARSAVLLALLVAGWQAPARAQQPLSLDQAYRLAVRNNPNFAVLRERVVQAEAARYRAWSAIKPTANLQTTYTHYDREIAFDVGPASVVIQPQNQFGLVVAGALPLFRGPAYPRIGAARNAVEAARLREIRTRQDFLLRVAQAYYLVVTRKDAVKALETKLSVDRKHLAAAKARFEVGQSPRTEVLRADLVATQDEQNLLAQRNGVQAARRALAILIGAPGAPDVERPAEPPSPAGSGDAMLATAHDQRADLKAADLALVIAQQTRKAVWWSFLPLLDLNFVYRDTRPSSEFNPAAWNLVATLSFPIYDGGQRYADLRETRSRIAEAAAQKQALELDIETEIVRLRADLASATAGVVSARKALSLAKTTAEDMEASFQVGASTQLDVLDATQRLLDAELGLSSALFNRDLARLALAHAQGRFDPLRASR